MNITRVSDLQKRKPRQNYRRPLPDVETLDRQAAGLDDLPVDTEALAEWKRSMTAIGATALLGAASWAIILAALMCWWKGCS